MNCLARYDVAFNREDAYEVFMMNGKYSFVDGDTTIQIFKGAE